MVASKYAKKSTLINITTTKRKKKKEKNKNLD